MNYYLLSFCFTVTFILFLAMFYNDYDIVAANVKGSKYKDLIQAEKEYQDNGCYVKESGVCIMIKKKMNNLQEMQPPMITVLSAWITDGINSLLSQFNVYTSVLLVVIILAFNFQNFINN